MSLSTGQNLAQTLVTLCDDALFTIAAAERLDSKLLRAFAKRRTKAIEAAASGDPPARGRDGGLAPPALHRDRSRSPQETRLVIA